MPSASVVVARIHVLFELGDDSLLHRDQRFDSTHAQRHHFIHLRRAEWLTLRCSLKLDESSITRAHDVHIDFGARVVRRGADELALRPKEFDLLAALVRHRGRVVSRADLLREVWGYAAGTESRTVETHLAALRERLGDDPQDPRYIVTVQRLGYKFTP